MSGSDKRVRPDSSIRREESVRNLLESGGALPKLLRSHGYDAMLTDIARDAREAIGRGDGVALDALAAKVSRHVETTVFSLVNASREYDYKPSVVIGQVAKLVASYAPEIADRISARDPFAAMIAEASAVGPTVAMLAHGLQPFAALPGSGLPQDAGGLRQAVAEASVDRLKTLWKTDGIGGALKKARDGADHDGCRAIDQASAAYALASAAKSLAVDAAAGLGGEPSAAATRISELEALAARRARALFDAAALRPFHVAQTASHPSGDFGVDLVRHCVERAAAVARDPTVPHGGMLRALDREVGIMAALGRVRVGGETRTVGPASAHDTFRALVTRFQAEGDVRRVREAGVMAATLLGDAMRPARGVDATV